MSAISGDNPTFSPLRALIAALAAGIAGCTGALPVAAQAPGALPTAGDAAMRFRTTMERAMEEGPAARSLESFLEAEAAARLAEAAAGGPSLYFQREGIGPSLDDRPNAVSHLGVATPFNAPGQAGRSRAVGAAARRWRSAAAGAGRTEEALRAGEAWLELAAEEERLELARRRFERLDRAVTLQQKRLELGEVAGTAVIQLELERAAEASRLRGTETRRLSLAAGLRTLVGGEFPAPVRGDLESLATDRYDGGTAAPFATPDAAAAEETAAVAAARHAAELAESRRRLARATAWGRPEVELEWQRVPDLDLADGYDAVAVGFTVPLPLGGQARHRVAESTARAAAAAAELDAARLAIEERLSAAAAGARTARATLAELASILERLTTAEHSLGEQFRLGAITYLVYIDGLSRLDDIRLQAVEARRTLLAARLELALLLGDPSLAPIPTPRTEDVP